VHPGGGSFPAAQPFPYIGLDPGRGEGVGMFFTPHPTTFTNLLNKVRIRVYS